MLINIFVITKVIVEINPKTEKENSNIVKKSTSKELGSWKTSNNGLFVFQDNKNFYQYESINNQKDNYYAGSYNYKKGIEALEEIGYTEEEFFKTFGEDTKLENVYSINLLPTILFKDGEDITTSELKENESWWFILIIKNDNTAIAYNKTLDLRYNLVKS